jgi:hypothetical protein
MNPDWENKRFLLSDTELSELLGELCVDLGFCSLTNECQRRLESSPLTIDEFIDAVLEGEQDFNPALTPDRLRKQIRSRVFKYYDAVTNHGLWWLQFRENRPE